MKYPCFRRPLQTAVIAVFVTSFSACAGPGNLSATGSQEPATQSLAPAGGSSRLAAGSAQAGTSRSAVQRHTVGLGPVVQTALGGTIFGWDINESGSDGVLAEAVKKPSGVIISAIETFHQTTNKITKIVAKQRSVTGNHELVVSGIVANDVGLIDDERDQKNSRNDIFHLMAPVTGGKFTGEWNPPHDRNLLIESVADQQSDPLVAIMVDDNNDEPALPEMLVSDVAKSSFRRTLQFPAGQIWYGPQIVAEDTQTHQAVVGAQAYSSNLSDFVVFDLAKGTVSTFPSVNGWGAFQGIAIDSTTDTMCTTTSVDFSVQFYNLKTHQGLTEQLPGADGEQQSGAAIAADPVNHLFLVSEPLSSVSPSGGSTIFVYDENGSLIETINGFSFSNRFSALFERVEVNATQRTGYVNGPNANQLQEFTY